MLFVISSSIGSTGAMDTTWWDTHANTKGSGDVLTNILNRGQVQMSYKFWTYTYGKNVVNGELVRFWVITFYLKIDPLENNGTSTILSSANITFQQPTPFEINNYNPTRTSSSKNEVLYFMPSVYPNMSTQIPYSIPYVEIDPQSQYNFYSFGGSSSWLLHFKNSAQTHHVSSNTSYMEKCSISLQTINEGTFNTIIVPFYISLNAPNSTPSVYTESVTNKSTTTPSLTIPSVFLGISVLAVSLLLKKRKKILILWKCFLEESKEY